MLDDISLLSLELVSLKPGEEGPLLDIQLDGPLHPTPIILKCVTCINIGFIILRYVLLLGDFKGGLFTEV